MSESKCQKSQAQIVFSPYGPYLAVDVDKLTDAAGNPLPLEPVTSLCRCGGSENKPFCDGTHSRLGFSGAKGTPLAADQAKDYVGKKITIHDNRGICSHAGHCTQGLPAVFKRKGRPWIDPDGAAPADIIAVIERCPSGALSYTIDSILHKSWHSGPAQITVEKNGPYHLTGDIRLKDAICSSPEAPDHCTLCRCGTSRNKPFCDGSHDEGFDDSK